MAVYFLGSAVGGRGIRSSVGEWLGHSLAVLGVDDSSLLKASQEYDCLNSPYAYLLGSIH